MSKMSFREFQRFLFAESTASEVDECDSFTMEADLYWPAEDFIAQMSALLQDKILDTILGQDRNGMRTLAQLIDWVGDINRLRDPRSARWWQLASDLELSSFFCFTTARNALPYLYDTSYSNQWLMNNAHKLYDTDPVAVSSFRKFFRGETA